MPEEFSTGELMRRMTDIQQTVHQIQARMESDYVRTIQLDEVTRRVGALEDTQKWLVRLILGVVIMALLGVVITKAGGV